MKRVVYSSINTGRDSKITFTPVEIVDLLRNISELDGLNISYENRRDGMVDFIVNEFVYYIA